MLRPLLYVNYCGLDRHVKFEATCTRRANHETHLSAQHAHSHRWLISLGSLSLTKPSRGWAKPESSRWCHIPHTRMDLRLRFSVFLSLCLSVALTVSLSVLLGLSIRALAGCMSSSPLASSSPSGEPRT